MKSFDILPSYIFLVILKEYLNDVNDLMSFDTAISQENIRWYYLSIYDNTVIPAFEYNSNDITKTFIHNSKTLNWVYNRSIKLNNIIVSNLSNKTLHLIDRIPTLSSITFDNCNLFHDEYKLQYCCNITSIIIRNSIISNNGLKSLTKHCMKLKDIVLDFEAVDEHDQYLSDTALYDITKNCKKLSNINVIFGLHISEACKQHLRLFYMILNLVTDSDSSICNNITNDSGR